MRRSIVSSSLTLVAAGALCAVAVPSLGTPVTPKASAPKTTSQAAAVVPGIKQTARQLESTGTGPWGPGTYTPRKGDWQPYVLSPASRTVKPAAVQRVAVRGGSITGNPASLLTDGGSTVRITSTGDRTTSPLVTLDMGKEVAGPIRIHVTAASDPRPQLHVCYSESMQYAAFSPSQNNGESTYAPGCDTANIWNGFPGTAYTWDSDSHTLPLADATLPATLQDPQLRGGYRYVTLFLDGPGWVDVKGLTTQFSAADDQTSLEKYRGHFLSSDNRLNKIWYAGAYTVQLDTDGADTAKKWPYATGETDHADAAVPGASSAHDVIYDGAKRDRDVWQGDLAVEGPTTLLSTNDRAAIRNSLTALASQQLPDGYVPAEGLVGQHNLDEERTYGEYVTWFIENLAQYYQWTGDRAYLQRWWPAMQKAATWLDAQRDSTGLISFQASGSCGHYGYSDCGHETYENALYAENMRQMATLAKVLGDPTDAATYTSRAQAVTTAINTQLWNPTVGAYELSLESPGVYPQDGNSIAVVDKIADASRSQRALAYLKAHDWSTLGSLTVSQSTPTSVMSSFYAPLASWFEVEARLEAGGGDGATQQTGLALMRKFWGWMLQGDPGSTFWEHVEPSGLTNLGQFSSLAHGWATGPTISLTTQVLGVSPTGAGFSTFSIAPHPGDLKWAQGTVPTSHGPISASWTSSANRFDLTTTVPRGAKGTYTVPLSGRALRVVVDKRTVWSRGSKVASARYVGGHVVVAGLTAGHHTITVDRLAPVATKIAVSLSAAKTTVAPGEQVAVTADVTGIAEARLEGTLRVTAPTGWTASERSLPVNLISDGHAVDRAYKLYFQVPDSTTATTGTIAVAVQAGKATASDSLVLTLRSATDRFDFEDGTTQGWTAGANVAGVAAVTSFANGPGTPYAGTYALEATSTSVPGTTGRTIEYDAPTPLNLSAAKTFELHADAYGGLPGGTGYQMEVTLTGQDGTTLDRTFALSNDTWNDLALDISVWPGREAITTIDVTFSGVGSTTDWTPRFQIDDVGWTN